MRRFFMTLLTAGILVTLAGCGESQSGTTTDAQTTNVSGIARGPIKDGTLTIYALNPDGTYGAVIETKSTSSTDGAYSATMSYSGDAIIEVYGGTYIDEATGRTVRLSGKLRTVVAGLTGSVTVAVTPMTEVAAAMALEDKSAYALKTKIQNANYVVGAMSGNINIINTQPADPTGIASKTAATDSVTYGLLLGTVSQMIYDGKAASVTDAVAKIKADLADGDYKAVTMGPVVKAALANFLANPRNKTGITSLTQTKLSGALDYITANSVYPPQVQSDLQMAKSLTSEVRNTILSVYNAQPSGLNGVKQTPFQDLSDELKTKTGKTLYTAVSRTVWFIQAAGWNAPGAYALTDPATGDTMNITISPNNASLTVVSNEGVSVAAGNLAYAKDGLGNIVSGSFNGTINAAAGAMAVSLNFADTVGANGLFASMAITGSVTGQGLSLDMTQAGRGLNITFSPQPDNASAIYASHITGSAVMTAPTAVLDGTLDLSTVWAAKDASVSGACQADAVPSTAAFNGTFATMQNGSPSGVKFAGALTGNWTNAATFDGCSPQSASNFIQWNAGFNGTITGPGYPALTAFLNTKENAYEQVMLDMTFKRVNADGSIVSITGSGSAGVNGGSTGVLTVSLSDQFNMNMNMTIDNTRACTDPAYFTGNITASGGAVIGNGYTLSCMPMIKYMDGYFESVL